MKFPAPFTLFVRHTLYWLTLFLFFRIIFLAGFGPWHEGLSWGHIFFSLAAGWRLDLSVSAYIFSIPFLLSLAGSFQSQKWIPKLLRWYYLIAICVAVILQTGNIAIYKYWGILLNNRAFAFAADPAEVAASLTTVQFIFIASTLIVLCGLFIFLYRRMLTGPYSGSNSPVWYLPVLVVMVLTARGGLQQIPVNESAAYYSENTRLNHTAVNSLWHLGNSLRQASITDENPYRIMDDSAAQKITRDLIHPDASHTPSILKKSERPNVVIIILESWTADIIEPLQGIKGVTPFFTELTKGGLLFTQVYSSGFRTDQGIISVLSGFPAQPNKSVIRFPDKTQKLPGLANSFRSQGYHTSFFYGGELGFANMKSYLLSSGFEQITGKDDFPSNTMNSKWGAHDGVVMQKQIRTLSGIPQPFFSVLLTLSTHEPFEVPVETPFKGTEEAELFKKAAWYTDQSLKEYFHKAAAQSWFQNTVFVLVADHGHRLPLMRAYEDPAIRHIPLLIWSPLLADTLRGHTYPAPSTQNDITVTLLEQLGMNHQDYHWSNDMLKTPRNNFAYQSLDESIIWITDSDTLHLPLQDQHRPAEGDTLRARAFLQSLFREFLNL